MPLDANAAIAFANEAFYAAFAGRELAAMDALWAEETPVSCIHPGWNPIIGRDRVMESWRAILTNPSSPRIACRQPTVHRVGAVAVVLCFEVIGEAVLAATNIFIQEKNAWRLVHHQAGPLTVPPPESVAEPERLQ